MKIKQCRERYGVSEELMQQFINAGVAEDLLLHTDDDFEREDVQKRLSFCICLHSLGLDIPVIKDYLFLDESKEGSAEARIAILRKARNTALKQMHDAKDLLECINAMMKELKSSI